jgi:pimeloyl-ACP methyl ester carboxylesterase
MGFVFLILTIMGMVTRFYYKKPIQKHFAWLTAYLSLILIHVVLNGYQWQFLLLYTPPVILIIDGVLESLKRVYRNIFRALWLLPMIGFFMVMIFPEIILEKPTGQYPVGTLVMNLEDDRRDIYDEEGGNREIKLQIFYPANEKLRNPVPWFLDGPETVKTFANSYNMPSLFFAHLTEVKSHSYLDAEISEGGPFPVIILSHGWGSSRILHLNQSENLASHGYIVVAIDHTYAAAMTRLSSGEIIGHKESILPEIDFLDEAKEMIEVFSGDIEAARNHLDFLQENHPNLKGQMDLSQIGLLGHSTGAGGDVYYAMNHDVQAIVGLDPWVEPLLEIEDLNIPSLYMRSEEWMEGPNNENLKKLTFEVYTIKDSTHQDFTMAGILSPIQRWLGWSGKDSLKLQEKMVLDFFEKTLKNKSLDFNYDDNERIMFQHP